MPDAVQTASSGSVMTPKPISRTIFIALLTLALAKGLVWAAILPPWLGPDEPAHYSYVQVMVEDHWLARGPDPSGGKYYAQEIDCSQCVVREGVHAKHQRPEYSAHQPRGSSED